MVMITCLYTTVVAESKFSSTTPYSLYRRMPSLFKTHSEYFQETHRQAKWTESNVLFARRMATTEKGSTLCKYIFALATVPTFFDIFDIYNFM